MTATLWGTGDPDLALANASAYLDATGASIAIPAAGLDATARARVRAVALHLTLLPTGLRGRTERAVVAAVRKVS